MGSACRRELVLVAAVVLTGCSGNPDYAVVTGKVLLDGAPVEGAFVEFLPVGGQGSTSRGKTDASGAFRMRRSQSQDGVHRGPCLVRIHTGDTGRGPGEKVPERIPEAYHQDSTLECEVVKSRHAFLFELSSQGDPVTPRAID